MGPCFTSSDPGFDAGRGTVHLKGIAKDENHQGL